MQSSKTCHQRFCRMFTAISPRFKQPCMKTFPSVRLHRSLRVISVVRIIRELHRKLPHMSSR